MPCLRWKVYVLPPSAMPPFCCVGTSVARSGSISVPAVPELGRVLDERVEHGVLDRPALALPVDGGVEALRLALVGRDEGAALDGRGARRRGRRGRRGRAAAAGDEDRQGDGSGWRATRCLVRRCMAAPFGRRVAGEAVQAPNIPQRSACYHEKNRRHGRPLSRPAEEDMSELETLLAEMVRIDSSNPGLAGGPGEAAFAAHLARLMERLGMEVDLWDVAPRAPQRGRPAAGHRRRAQPDAPGSPRRGGSLGPGRLRARRQGRPHVRPRRRRHEVRHRGGAPRRRGAARERRPACRRPAGRRRDRRGVGEPRRRGAPGALAPGRVPCSSECTGLEVVTEHGGFAWYEIESRGVEAAGADPEHGVDGIALLAPVLAGITALDAELERRPRARYGRGSIHASTIAGGDQLPAYPARCAVGVERCLIAGETVAQAHGRDGRAARRGARADRASRPACARWSPARRWSSRRTSR